MSRLSGQVSTGGSANALASCLVPVPRARIHAEIRRAGAFGQRGGTRLLRNTRGGAMPLVHGPHRVKSSIIEPQDALVNAAFLWALRSANAPASRAGTPVCIQK